MGTRLAHLMRGYISDFLPIDADFLLARTSPPVRVADVPWHQSECAVATVSQS